MMFMTDSATGLYSRGYVLDYLRNAILRSLRSRESVTLLLFELRQEGERVPGSPGVPWRRVADAFRSATRRGDLLGRIRPHEILLVPSGPLPCALHVMHRAMERVRCWTGECLRAGIARAPEDGLDPALLIATAQTTLEWVKKEPHEDGCLRAR
ncbi:MAG TPA: hypothetical protein VEN81_07525 [Planctomycetota bacterium]|nr:hypothetical protein [Planctomycetota bacterium]